jgi:hypothetical protein
MTERVEEAVPLPNEAVEVWQRIDRLRAPGRIVGDDCQPEAKLGEPYRCSTQVHTKQVVLENAPAGNWLF